MHIVAENMVQHIMLMQTHRDRDPRSTAKTSRAQARKSIAKRLVCFMFTHFRHCNVHLTSINSFCCVQKSSTPFHCGSLAHHTYIYFTDPWSWQPYFFRYSRWIFLFLHSFYIVDFVQLFCFARATSLSTFSLRRFYKLQHTL